jgi:hypothetical protein
VIRIEWTDEFVALEHRSDGILEFGEYERNATGVEFLVEIDEHVGGSGVDVGHWLSSNEEPARSWRSPCEATCLVVESAGVGEEQGCVEAENHESRKFLSFGVLSPVVLARQSCNAAERCLVWPPCSSKHIDVRERHGDRNTRKDSEQRYTEKCRDGEQELDTPLMPESYRSGDVGQRG